MPVFLCTSSHQHWCEPTVSLALKGIASLVFSRRSTTPHQQGTSSFPGPTSGETVQATSIGEPLSAGLKGLGLHGQTKISTLGARYGRDEGGGEERKSRHLLPLCATVGRTQVPGTKAWPGAIIPDCDHLRPPSKSQITGFQRSCESYIDLGA